MPDEVVLAERLLHEQETELVELGEVVEIIAEMVRSRMGEQETAR